MEAGGGSARALTFALRRLQLATHEATQALARRLGVGPTDVTALQVLAASDEPVGPVELGHRLGIRSASATVLVDRLVASGHVERRRHPADGRRVVLQITERSRAETRAALQPMITALDEVAAALPVQTRAAVVAALDDASAALVAFAALG